jgi:hypothetical protein
MDDLEPGEEEVGTETQSKVTTTSPIIGGEAAHSTGRLLKGWDPATHFLEGARPGFSLGEDEERGS